MRHFKTKESVKQWVFKENAENKKIVENAVVFVLSCNECPLMYTGQTTRTLSQRFKEHTLRKKPNLHSNLNHLLQVVAITRTY